MVTTQFRRTITLTIMAANISGFTVTKSFFVTLMILTTCVTSAVVTGPSPTWQSNITCVTNNNHL